MPLKKTFSRSGSTKLKWRPFSAFMIVLFGPAPIITISLIGPLLLVSSGLDWLGSLEKFMPPSLKLPAAILIVSPRCAMSDNALLIELKGLAKLPSPS